MKDLVYKVRDKNTNLFLTGRGYYPQWTERGRVYTTVWACRAAMKLRDLYDRGKIKPEIVEFELVPTGEKYNVDA